MAEFLSAGGTGAGWPAGGIRLLPIVETALGVINVREITLADTASTRWSSAPRTWRATWAHSAWPRLGDFLARSAVVTAAKAYRLQAIDMVYFDLNDLAGFEAECRLGQADGLRRQDGNPPATGRDRPAVLPHRRKKSNVR